MTGLPIVPFTQATTIRLISTAYIDEPAMAPLADSDTDLAFLESIEALTSPRLAPRLPVPGGLSPDELVGPAHGYGWTYINAAFCYTRITGNRFNGPERGAWYAAYGRNAAATAQAEVSWHLTRELEATGIFDNLTAYRELRAGFATSFHDLSGQPAHPALDRDPATGYPAGQSLARALLTSGSNGLLYPSTRHPRGKCLAAFRPALVQNIRQGDTWTFRWSGTPTPAIEKQ